MTRSRGGNRELPAPHAADYKPGEGKETSQTSPDQSAPGSAPEEPVEEHGRSPTTTNCELEFPAFGEIAGVSSLAQVGASLGLEKPPARSRYFPYQVNMRPSPRLPRHPTPGQGEQRDCSPEALRPAALSAPLPHCPAPPPASSACGPAHSARLCAGRCCSCCGRRGQHCGGAATRRASAGCWGRAVGWQNGALLLAQRQLSCAPAGCSGPLQAPLNALSSGCREAKDY